MKFKVLKHKTLPDTFGVFQSEYSSEEGEVKTFDVEIYQSYMPQLLGEKTTIDDLESHCFYHTSIKQLKDYDLVTVQITVLD